MQTCIIARCWITRKGCILGDDKPFDCRIWPLRVMALNETKVITLSPVCPTMNEKSIKELTKTANELADQIFEYADEKSGSRETVS